MDPLLNKHFKNLKDISPCPNFSAQSKAAILAEVKIARKENVSMPISFAKRQIFAAVSCGLGVIALLFVGVTSLKTTFDKSSAIAKANEINNSIQVKLNEIRYIVDSGKIDLNSLNKAVITLQEVKQDLESASDMLKKDEVDNLVQKIESAQESVKKIEEDLK